MPADYANRRASARRWLLACLAVACAIAGCSRSRARLRADEDAYHAIDQKSAAVRGEVGDYRIGLPVDSRMFDPNDPDCPARPEDDPLSNTLMRRVDGKRGAKLWRKAPVTPYVENPFWRSALPVDDRGRLVLDIPAAVRLGLRQDPQYQSELEDLYLAALDVSFERFQFDTQLLGGSAIDFVAQGRDASGTGESSSVLTVAPSDPANQWQLQKLTATGGELVAGIANSLVWQFSGPNDYTSFTLLNFSVFQPLLRGGGRLFTLENLTLTERTLLANIRAIERFRREYYVNVVTGRATGAGPVRRSGPSVGGGLPGFGLGGFVSGTGGGGVGGYLGLLQTQQVLRNQRANVAALRDSTLQLEASYDAGRIDRFQVDLARQALLNAQSGLLNSEAAFQTALDAFKTGLGLPPDLEIRLSDDLLERFNLLDPELVELQTETADLLVRARTASKRDKPPGALAKELPAPGADAQPASPADALLLFEAADARFADVEADFENLLAVAPRRREHLVEIGQRREVRQAQIDPAFFDPARLDGRIELLRDRMAAWGSRQATLRDRLTAPGADANLVRLVGGLSQQLLELTILKALARLDAIDLTPTELSSAQALSIARANRRDLANARAALVDSWRVIHFTANDLRSALDVTFSGDVRNVGDEPFDLRSSAGTLAVGLAFDSPTSRLAERNVFRASQIAYQRARRELYQFDDAISQSLRETVRQARLNEIDLEVSREAVFVAIAQVDLTQLRLSEPPKPGVEGQFSATTARDLVDALGNLLNVQNGLLFVWVNSRAQRLDLELDLGLMELDNEGLRVPIEQPLTLFAADDCEVLDAPAPKRLPPVEEPGGGGAPVREAPVTPSRALESRGLPLRGAPPPPNRGAGVPKPEPAESGAKTGPEL